MLRILCLAAYSIICFTVSMLMQDGLIYFSDQHAGGPPASRACDALAMTRSRAEPFLSDA